MAVAELSKARVLSNALGAGAAAALPQRSLAAGGANGGAVFCTTPSTPPGADWQEAGGSVDSSTDLAEVEWRAMQDMAKDECCVVEYSELSDGKCSGHMSSRIFEVTVADRGDAACPRLMFGMPNGRQTGSVGDAGGGAQAARLSTARESEHCRRHRG